MNQYKLLSLIGTALAGTLVANNPVQAFTFSLNNVTSGVFSYDVTLDSDESLVEGQPLILTGLGGVTAVDSTRNSSLQYSDNGFTSGDDSINFSVSTPISSSTSSQLFEDVITLTSNNPTGDITYSAFIVPAPGQPGFITSSAQGPITPVPFELSPDIGLFTIFGIFGLNYYRKKSKTQS